jgi:Anti-sigma-28 factor, FlgM
VRIDHTRQVGLEPLKPHDRVDYVKTDTQYNGVSAAPSDDVSRADRIEKLKQMFSAGKPIDVNKLADKLIESGMLFDDKVCGMLAVRSKGTDMG